MTSIFISLVLMGLMVYVASLAFTNHRQHPGVEAFWMLLASVALVWGAAALFFAALASGLVQMDSSLFPLVSHLTLLARGGSVFLAAALVYGALHLHDERGV